MMKVEVTVTKITPDAARKLLQHNVSNRPLRGNRVRVLARAIREKRWVLNGASVVIDSKNRLLDGQHRLHAVINVNKSIETVLVRGVSPQAFDTIDQGAKRSGTDIFSICGVRNPAIVSAALGIVWQSQHGIVEGSTGGQSTPDMDERVALFDTLPDFEEVIAEATRYKLDTAGVFPFSALAGLYFLFHSIDASVAQAFLQTVVSGKGPRDNPAVTLRRKFEQLAADDYRVGRQTQCAYIKIAWNAFVGGDAIRTIKLPKTLEVAINKVTSKTWTTRDVLRHSVSIAEAAA